MPDGVLLWFDPSADRGRIRARSGREVPVYGRDLPARARAAGARVHFDLEISEGIELAVRVSAIDGTRSSHRQGRHGDLVGARQPADKGGTGLSRGAPDRALTPARPADVVSRWAAAASTGAPDGVLPLYAPDAVLHVDGRAWRGRDQVRQGLLDASVLGPGWDPHVEGVDGVLSLLRGPALSPVARAHFRVVDGEIVEQWVRAGA